MPWEEQRRKQIISESKTDYFRWTSPQSLDAAWESRALRAADRIPAGAIVLDMGCGAMTLERYLPRGSKYIPCDLIQRDPRTIVCDFNAGQIPDEIRTADRIVMLGLLEYIYDLPRFLVDVAASGKAIVASYCPTDLTAGADRSALGWVNHYSTAELQGLFAGAGLIAKSIEKIDQMQLLYVLDHFSETKPLKNVLVLSCANCGNFGDRLGIHMINAVLPSNAKVWNAYLTPWSNISGTIDLLVVGIGNSLYQPLITNQLIDLIHSAKRSIGIFGTQYRDQLPAGQLMKTIDALDIWFARSEEDLLLYAPGKPNAIHLGDWLIDAFPMTEANDTSTLTIGNEIWNELPLDRVIQKIQNHVVVHSTRLHPLLCALTSAQKVAYSEQRETGGVATSGKFRSLLLDVFGRDFPEGEFWDVDKAAVHAYKQKVRENVAHLRRSLSAILND